MKAIPRELRKPNTNSNFHRELRKSLSLNELQKEVLLGSLMGDGCLIANSSQTNYRLQIEHSDRQKDYVFWKYELFKNFVLSPPKYLTPTRSWKFRTISHPELSRYHRVFYENKKKILPNDITFLSNPLTSAIWFMDDGGRLGNSGCLINIQNFTDDEAFRLRNFFREILAIPVTLHRNKRRFRLYIPSAYKLKWSEYIGDYLRSEFKYKIPQAP